MKSKQIRACLLLASALLMLLPRARGGSEVSSGTFSIYVENDLFAGTDRQYTSRVKLGWSSADLENYSDSPYASGSSPTSVSAPR